MKEHLSVEKKLQLESLAGWTWVPYDDDWDEAFQLLLDYVEEYKNPYIHADYKTMSNFKLGRWLVKQKGQKSSIPQERRDKLESIEGWVWNKRELNWEIAFGYVQDYVEEFRNARIPNRYISKNGFQLGKWVNKQRSRKVTLSQTRIERLNNTIGWSWNKYEADWENAFSALEDYISKNQSSLVPAHFVTEEGLRLSNVSAYGTN
jgi:hypothetical protein